MSDNSGPAFPVRDSWWEENDQKITGYLGLTKREWFAGMALQAIINGWTRVNDSYVPECDLRSIAEQSFKIADAMLAKSEK